MKRLLQISPILCVVLQCVLLGAAACASAEPIASLHPSNYVNDFAGVLDTATQARLNDLCREVEQKAKAQIAVVTVKSTDGEDITNYAVDLYQKWGIGKKGNDRGVLILLATNDHKYFTSVGYGLEPILPDGKVGGFGREMVPLLRAGNYSAAATLITSRIASVIAQDAGVKLDNQPNLVRPDQVRSRPSPGIPIGAVLILIFIAFSIITAILRAIFGGRGGPRGGGGSGLLSGLLWGMLFSNLGGGRGYGGGGFGGGGFGGGGGGFGGFGGGSTGGGGAGGSW